MDRDVEKLKQDRAVKIRTCDRCDHTGPDADFHIAGNSGRINVCRKCVSVQRQLNRKRKEAGLTEIGPESVIIDFGPYPEIRETLEADAKRNFRTLQNEILYRLVG